MSFSRSRPLRGTVNRFAHNDLVAAITGPGDEERIDRHAGDLGEDERAVGQANVVAKKMRRCRRQISLHAIALNRNDFAERGVR